MYWHAMTLGIVISLSVITVDSPDLKKALLSSEFVLFIIDFSIYVVDFERILKYGCNYIY